MRDCIVLRERTTLATIVGQILYHVHCTLQSDHAFILCKLSCCKYTNLHRTLNKSSLLTLSIKDLCKIEYIQQFLMATAVNDNGCVSICPENSSTSTFPNVSFTRALTCRLSLLSLSVYAIDALVVLQVCWQITRTFLTRI